MLVTQQQRSTNLAAMLAYHQKREEESSVRTGKASGVSWIRVQDLQPLKEFIIYADLEAISASTEQMETDKSLGTLSGQERNQSENDRLSEVEPGEEREDLEWDLMKTNVEFVKA